jgi:DNA invertase Pin-like site-specific DNA recombinase
MRYVIYSRKSSEEKTKQVQSIESQIVEMKRIAERENLSIVKIFREEKSAKKPGRKVFGEMIKFIEDKHADAILCWKLDRLARNPADEGMVKWMLQQSIIKEIKTNDRDYKPDDNVLLSSVEFGMANQFILDLSKSVRRGQKTKLEKGGWPNMAPLGYKNENSTIVADKERSKYIRKAFELSATGGYSVKDIANILFKEGFRSRAGIKYHKSRIHKLLHNPFYYGVMKLYGMTQNGNHEPLISKELFDKVQMVLQGKHHTKTKNHFFALRGFMRCEVCGCLLTATLKKGHQYYYCTNGKGNCTEHRKYFRSETLDKTLADKFQDLKFNPKLVEIAYKAAKVKTI